VTWNYFCLKICCRPQKLALTSPTSGGRSDGVVRSLSKATELLLLLCILCQCRSLLCLRHPDLNVCRFMLIGRPSMNGICAACLMCGQALIIRQELRTAEQHTVSRLENCRDGNICNEGTD
jgi:hypothetical protein